MFEYNHYVPILKAKDGEFGALLELPKEIKRLMTPLIDIFNTESSKKTLEERLFKYSDKINRSWGNYRPIFIDLFGIDLDERVSEGIHPLKFIFDCLRKHSVKAIPTTGFDRDKEYDKALRKTVSKDKRGVCVRLLIDDMENLEELEDNLESLIIFLGIKYQDVHLLLDFRELTNDHVSEAIETAVNVIKKLPKINKWKTVTVVASGFPGSLSAIGTDAIGKISRTELQLWNEIIKRKKEINRLPSFGDYGVQHPDLLELDWGIIPLVPNIRYTLPTEWLIIRGRSTRKHGFQQSYKLTRNLSRMREYYGDSYCWGDNHIAQCAQRTVGPGNMTTWRKVGTNHHLTLVSEQVANSVVL